MDKQECINNSNSKRRCYFVLLLIIIIYLLENLPLFSFSHSTIYVYIVKPIIWTGIFLAIWFFPRVKYSGKLRLYSTLKWWTIYMAFAYISSIILAGMIEGFGRSPYDLSPYGILTNMISFGSLLVGREYARAYLINGFAKKRPVITILIITLLMTLMNISISQVTNLKGGIDTLQYIGENILPEFAKNILASYVVYMGGAVPSIFYLGIIQGFELFSPFLPNLTWITTALIDTLCPIFSLMFLQYIYNYVLERRRRRDNENPLGWIITGVVSVSIVWFAVGVFPIYPEVIATGSMEPLIYPGDVVLVQRINSVSDIKIGEIVQYEKEKVYIFHRIIEIKDDNGETKYVTKGDNNSIPDGDPVSAEQIKGKVVQVVPKIGWPTLLLKSENSMPNESVEF